MTSERENEIVDSVFEIGAGPSNGSQGHPELGTGDRRAAPPTPRKRSANSGKSTYFGEPFYQSIKPSINQSINKSIY